MAGLLNYMRAKTQIEATRRYGIDYYAEHRERVDIIVGLLPEDFFNGFSELTGTMEEIIADYAYPMLVADMVKSRDVTYLTTDLDGDRGTDLLAGTPETILNLLELVLELINSSDKPSGFETPLDLFRALGFKATHGMSIQSLMHTMDGGEIYEMLLGTADSMLNRLLDGNEGGKSGKSFYDPRIHFELTIAATLRANPNNPELEAFCEEAMGHFDTVYGDGVERPPFMDGYAQLKELITPWRS